MDLTELHLHWGARSYKGKSYRSYSLARSYRKDGKDRKEIVLKLGKLTNDQATKWRNVLKAIKTPHAFFATLDDLVVTEHFLYLDVAVANGIWDHWKLDEAFANDDKKKLRCATIARILALNRCIDPAAKSQTPEWFRHTALPWLLDVDPDLVNASRIFRDLDVIEHCKEAICKHLFERLHAQAPDGLKSVFYDLSSTTFHGSRCVLMKWGHCKEGYHNHVVLALVVNREGVPFFWEVLRGGTADATTITWLLERLEARFKISGTTVVFDRGMVSDNNLVLLEKARIKYISAMDRNQLEGITRIDFTTFSALEPERIEEQVGNLSEFTKLSENTYYREVKVEGERRYILCFNPQLFKDQRKARSQAVENFRSFVEDLNKELCAAKKSRQRKPTYEKFKQRITNGKLTHFVDVNLKVIHVKRKASDGSKSNVRTYTGTAVVDEKQMLFAGRLDGFWLLVTNHKDKQGDVFNVPAQDAITPYRDKVVIESAFRDIKSFVEVAPIHVWTEVHVKAHYAICVLSHLINRTLTLRLHKHPGKATKEIVFHEGLYAKLSDCMIDRIEVENVQLSTYSMTRPTDYQRELLQRVGLENLLSSNVVKKARISKHR
jgi:transposase